jgi:hypothetical protein
MRRWFKQRPKFPKRSESRSEPAAIECGAAESRMHLPMRGLPPLLSCPPQWEASDAGPGCGTAVGRPAFLAWIGI